MFIALSPLHGMVLKHRDFTFIISFQGLGPSPCSERQLHLILGLVKSLHPLGL